MKGKNLFEMLEGFPAQVLVIGGLALVLFAPLIPQFKLAAVSSARSAYDNAEAMIELEMEEIRREQEKANKQDDEMMASMTYEQRQTRMEEQRKKQKELERVADEKREELKKRFDRTSLKREMLIAQKNAAGMRWHLVLGWLGRLALIAGLLTLTVRAEGVTQKIYLVVLLIVLFSALTGVQLGFLAAGQMGGGESGSIMEAIGSGRR